MRIFIHIFIFSLSYIVSFNPSFAQSWTQELTFDDDGLRTVSVTVETRQRSLAKRETSQKGNKMVIVFENKTSAFIDFRINSKYEFKSPLNANYRVAVDPDRIKSDPSLDCEKPTEITDTRKGVADWDISLAVRGEGAGVLEIPFLVGERGNINIVTSSFKIPYEIWVERDAYQRVLNLEKKDPEPYELYQAYGDYILHFQQFQEVLQTGVTEFLRKKNDLVEKEWAKIKDGSIITLCDFNSKYDFPTPGQDAMVENAIKLEEERLWKAAKNCEKLKEYKQIFSSPQTSRYGVHKGEADREIARIQENISAEWSKVLQQVNALSACKKSKRRVTPAQF
jgi:hypothetical protein